MKHSSVGHRCLQMGISLREIYSDGFLDNVRINYKTRKVAPGTNTLSFSFLYDYVQC